jgi:TatA/E family protein of Tat protein translocase
LDFFGVGFGEVLLVLVLALIIWGPGKIVNVAKTLGKVMHNLKKATSDLTTQITSETEEKDESASVQKTQLLDK